jgi:hypothetical protein
MDGLISIVEIPLEIRCTDARKHCAAVRCVVVVFAEPKS